MTVADDLAKLAELYLAKHAEYGDDSAFGRLMEIVFPEGLTLANARDFNRAALFFHIWNKILRYGHNFKNGGHVDSLRDISVYAAMLREIDARPPDRLRDDVPHAEPNGEQRSPASDRGVSRFPIGFDFRREQGGD
jgi:hypothetical protein